MEQTAKDDLQAVLTKHEPLGPRATEDMLHHPDALRELYDKKSDLAAKLVPRRPAYVVGRKGAGKTAFLIGEGLTSGADVLSIKAANAFSIVDQLRRLWEDKHGTMPVDNVAYLWEAVIVHGAMRGVLEVARRSDTARIHLIQQYLALVAPREDTSTGQSESQFLAALGQTLQERIEDRRGVVGVRDMLASIGAAKLTYTAVKQILTDMVEDPDRRAGLCVVVDNLEDLHMRVDGLTDVLAGLFRLVSRVTEPYEPITLPFELRFAFPAEMTRRLRTITANPEKDFRNRLTIEWTAAELIELAGLRLNKSLQINFPSDLRLQDQLEKMTPEETLRAVLPQDDNSFISGLGRREDPVGYIMRHTQLLPRHLIQILNKVASPMFSGAGLRRVTSDELLRGVRDAERTIREGVLSGYTHEYPLLGDCLERLRNRVPLSFPLGDLNSAFHAAGVKRATGVRFEEFLWGAMTAGVFGIRRAETDRYVIGDFSYTYEGALQPIDDDVLCLHPLFVHVMNDGRALHRLRKSQAKPIYPYGSGVEGEDG